MYRNNTSGQRRPDFSIFLFSFMLSAGLTSLLKSNHLENRICHRTDEVVRRGKQQRERESGFEEGKREARCYLTALSQTDYIVLTYASNTQACSGIITLDGSMKVLDIIFYVVGCV